MAIILTLTNPITKPSTLSWRLERMTVDFIAESIAFNFLGNDGLAGSATYPTPAIKNPLGNLQSSGHDLIVTLNTFNFSAGSNMQTLIYQFLQADGYLGAGVISGAQV